MGPLLVEASRQPSDDEIKIESEEQDEQVEAPK